MPAKPQPFAPEDLLGPERRTLTLEGVEWRESVASGERKLIMRGHAAVFDRLSLDLGGFRERIAPGAFTAVLDRNPDVHLLVNHDLSRPLARTRSPKFGLELREDPRGLHFYANVAPTSYAEDLSILMDAGVVDQASFAFTVERDEWEIDADERVTRTILEVADLYDVTITAQGAYPQTDTGLVTHMRSLIGAQITSGRLPEQARAAMQNTVAPADPAGDQKRTVAPDEPVGGESSHEPDEAVGETKRDPIEELKSLRAYTRTETELAKRRILESGRKRR